MADTSIPQLRQRIQQARWRLFWQTWLNHLPYCCAATLLVAALWLLAQPYLIGAGEPELRWAILGGALAVGTVVALGLAWWRADGRVLGYVWTDDRLAAGFVEEEEAAGAGVKAFAYVWAVHRRAYGLGMPASAVLDPALYAPMYLLDS